MTDSSIGCPGEEQLLAYAEGALAEADRAGVERHLAGCAPCRKQLDEVRNLLRVSSLLNKSQLNPRDVERIDRCVQTTLDEVRRGGGKSRP